MPRTGGAASAQVRSCPRCRLRLVSGRGWSAQPPRSKGEFSDPAAPMGERRTISSAAGSSETHSPDFAAEAISPFFAHSAAALRRARACRCTWKWGAMSSWGRSRSSLGTSLGPPAASRRACYEFAGPLQAAVSLQCAGERARARETERVSRRRRQTLEWWRPRGWARRTMGAWRPRSSPWGGSDRWPSRPRRLGLER